MLSSATAEHLTGLVDSGWHGPVLIVGSVAEAREALQGEVAPARATASPTTTPRQGAGGPAAGAAAVTTVVDLGRLRLDVDQRRVVNAPLAESLTPLEFGVLEALLRQPGRVQRFAELTRSVWGVTYTGDCSPLHAVVKRLRGKLELVRAPVQLSAVRGVGFRLAPRPIRAEPRLGGALASI
ncbi:winged helix-turn-helix domain-containing protein [Ornithinimicrobium sp. LYQ92]|uniref:winged helix-turn-helix domain-containing protein n=1 Tax=Serinicoccus sp. LYQ92 TaxID=3378798 RepID=UPI003854F310